MGWAWGRASSYKSMSRDVNWLDMKESVFTMCKVWEFIEADQKAFEILDSNNTYQSTTWTQISTGDNNWHGSAYYSFGIVCVRGLGLGPV